jgi:hypothetical protein
VRASREKPFLNQGRQPRGFGVVGEECPHLGEGRLRIAIAPSSV